jgi:dTDP-4-amino-4,6-dideoxygalactose transaminase
MTTTTPITDQLPAIAGNKPAKTTPFASEPRYGEEELAELKDALAQGTLFYAHGKKVKQMEAEFAQKMGFQHAVATSSGTSAIHATLIALGISPGDEIILPPITDMGSIIPILFQGAVPVFADVEPHTYNLSANAVESKITGKTRAILAVHLAGNACDMDALTQVAKRHNLPIVEDCAQAHGTTYRAQAVGHFGVAGCYSFNEFKHIACGDGGVIMTNDEAFAKRARLATDKGYSREPGANSRSPEFLANNYRMTELQGAVALAQVRKVDHIIQRRRQWCSELTTRIANLKGLQLPEITRNSDHSWWFYLMRVDPKQLGATADDFAAALRAEGLPVNAHYIGRPVYLYPLFTTHRAWKNAPHAFESQRYEKGLCPIAEEILETCVQLPINEAYTPQDLEETTLAITRTARYFHTRR